MDHNYENIFEQRGSSYDQAMRLQPSARDQEFQQLISATKLTGKEAVADIPAGGGYLKRHLPSTCHYNAHEPCSSFSNHADVDSLNNNLLPLPWDSEMIDVAFSLAGVHHIDDKRPLFAEVYRTIKPEGVFILSDVSEGSSVARFLDHYVGAHNSTGHEGVYLNNHTLLELEDTGWKTIETEQKEFHWVFPNVSAMENFCNRLFDINTPSPGQTLDAISHYLGYSHSSTGDVLMNWSLQTITAVKV